ncbi:kelch repeat-containing protein [Vitiosangium sp. GDMCC 1.1324]|uniref:kelch repeat-containing protein n=1 Tax=Vitiosangium sp. (strain GDMCC 1.1324) TaxID=2138576 RepID=UPI00130E7D23|nr:kelch repeat-containing protein [Vitiosangium sp. GDMCC 1.1324]
MRADLYDPDTGTWSQGRDNSTPRSYHQAALLPSGQVLVVGGGDGDGYALGMLYTP